MSVVLLRHASAGDRGAWGGDDRARPLDRKGRRQALALCTTLTERRIARIVSSPYLRCLETVEPLAAILGLEVESDERLAEGADHDEAFAALGGEGSVACTHGDVVEELLGWGLKKGAAAILDLRDGGLAVVATVAAPR